MIDKVPVRSSTPDDIPSTVARRSKLKVGVAIVVALSVGLGAFLIFQPTSRVARVMVLRDGFSAPSRSFGIVSRLPQGVQQFVYRVKYRFFGPPKPVSLNASILHFEVPTEAIRPKLSLGKPEYADSNGLRIWLIPTNDLLALHLHNTSLSEIRELSSPRISTAHGIRASMAVTKMASIDGKQRPVGLTLDCLPYVRKNSIDLTMLLTLTEAATNQVNDPASRTNAPISIQTNCYAALRMQIPDGSGVFILHENPGRSGGKGVVLSVSTARTKK